MKFVMVSTEVAGLVAGAPIGLTWNSGGKPACRDSTFASFNTWSTI